MRDIGAEVFKLGTDLNQAFQRGLGSASPMGQHVYLLWFGESVLGVYGQQGTAVDEVILFMESHGGRSEWTLAQPNHWKFSCEAWPDLRLQKRLVG